MSKVTVLIPVYNGEQFLKQTIECVLSQTYQDFELLCIDDASTDNSADIIQSFQSPKINYIKNDKNLGIASTRNRGLELIETEYIAFLDQDDLTPFNRLEKEIMFLDHYLDIDAVGGNQKDIDQFGNVLRETWNVCHNPGYLKAFIMLSNTISNGSTMIRKDFIDKHHLRFQDNYYGVEDYRFWVDCSLVGKLANLDEVLLYWRTGHEQETSKVKESNRDARSEKIKEIQTIALEGNGLHLNPTVLDTLFQVFGEDSIIESEEQINLLYIALMEIVKQSKEKKLINQKEIATMCRKRFGEKIAKAFFLWESNFQPGEDL